MKILSEEEIKANLSGFDNLQLAIVATEVIIGLRQANLGKSAVVVEEMQKRLGLNEAQRIILDKYVVDEQKVREEEK